MKYIGNMFCTFGSRISKIYQFDSIEDLKEKLLEDIKRAKNSEDISYNEYEKLSKEERMELSCFRNIKSIINSGSGEHDWGFQYIELDKFKYLEEEGSILNGEIFPIVKFIKENA